MNRRTIPRHRIRHSQQLLDSSPESAKLLAALPGAAACQEGVMSRSAFAASSLAILAASALAASLAAQQPAHPANTKQAVDIRPNQQRDLAVQRELDAPADIRVERVPLAQFLETLSKPHKIRFQFDDAGLQRANVKPSVPITAQMKQIPLGVALQRFLRQWKLTYRIV